MLSNDRSLRVLAVFQQHGVTVQEYLFNYLWKNFGIRIDCMPIERIREEHVHACDLVLNVICNDAFQAERLTRIAGWAEKAGRRLVNPFFALSNCRRVNFSRLMRSNGFRAARVEQVPSRDALLAIEDLRYPVIVRQEYSHLGSTMQFVASRDQARVLDAQSFRKHTVVIEFHDFRAPDGLYHKYRCTLLGDRAIPRHVISSPEWNIHSGSRQAERMAEHQAEDEAFWAREVTEAPILLAAKQVVGLDYTIADYTLDSDGVPFFFEMNPCYSVIDERAFQRQWAHQLTAVHNYCEAYASFLFETAGRPLPSTGFATLPIVL